MIVPYGLVASYEGLIRELEDACTRANIGNVFVTEPLTSRFTPNAQNADIVDFTANLHLSEWKARAERIGILVHVREQIRRPTGPLLKSTIRVDYFHIQGRQAFPLHSVHFDYGAEEPYHPVFHAQVCGGTIPVTPDILEELRFEYKLEAKRGLCFKEARIPTSDMTFPSVLLSLAADHIHGEFFSQFLQYVREHQDGLPLPLCDRTRQSIRDSPHLRSSHWFAHME